MKRFAITVTLALALANAHAGELGMAWDWVNAEPPHSFIIERDGEAWPNVTNLEDPDAQDPTRSKLLVVGLPPGGACVPNAWTIRAVNAAGASDPSSQVLSIPRPAGPGGTGTINVILDNGGVHTIMGDYFPPNVVILVDGEPVVVTWESCQLLTIATTPGEPLNVCALNPALPTSPSCWNQPPPIAPTNLEPF